MRTVEVGLKLKTGEFQAGAREVERQAATLGKNIERTSEQTNRTIREQAELTAKIAEKHAENVAKAMQKWRQGAQILADTSQTLAGIGAIITGSILQSINAYVQNANKADSVSRRWLASTASIAESNQRIGRVAAQTVLPVLEKAADVAEKAARFAERNPQVISAALKIGTAITVLGAVGMAVSRGIRIYTDVAELASHLVAAKLQKEAAAQQLAAAGIQAKATGARVGGMALTGAGGVTAASLGAAVTPLTVLGGLGAGIAGYEALARSNFGQKIGLEANASAKGLSILAYGLGTLVGKGDEAFKAVAQWTGVMEKATQTAQRASTGITTLPDTQAGQVARTAQTENALAIARAQALAQAADAITDVEKKIAADRLEVQKQLNEDSASLEIEKARNAQLEALRAGWSAIDAERRAAQQRLQIQQQYQQAVAQAEATFAQAQAQASQNYARQQEDIERQYRQRLADIQKQYEEDEFEATLNRDAVALYRARRRRDQDTATAQQERDEQQRQAGQNYQDTLSAAQQARAESLIQAEQARQESLASLEQSIQEEFAAQQLADERERIEQQLQEKWRLEDQQTYLTQRCTQISASYAAELQAANQYYAAMRAMQTQYQSSADRFAQYSAASSGGVPHYQEGGYALGGLSLLHPGEFVLNPGTTRQLESAIGGHLTQQNVQNSVSLGGINVNGLGIGAREVARIAARKVEEQLLQALEE
jgi:hypothetical protein